MCAMELERQRRSGNNGWRGWFRIDAMRIGRRGKHGTCQECSEASWQERKDDNLAVGSGSMLLGRWCEEFVVWSAGLGKAG